MKTNAEIKRHGVRRYSGSLRIYILIVDDRASHHGVTYQCLVSTPDENFRVAVGPPAYLRHAIDSPIAYDEVASAAISFAEDEHRSYVADYADYDRQGSGYAIRRVRDGAPVRRHR